MEYNFDLLMLLKQKTKLLYILKKQLPYEKSSMEDGIFNNDFFYGYAIFHCNGNVHKKKVIIL